MIRVLLGTCVVLTAVVAFATRSAPTKGPSVGESQASHAEPVLLQSPASASTTAGAPTPRRVAALNATKAASSVASEPAPDIADPTVFRQQQQALLANELEHETRDEPWADRAHADIEASMAIHKDIETLDVDCRESLCRLDLKFRDDPASSPDMGAIARSIPWEMHAYFEVDADGSNARLYVAREGRTLPVI